jgi:hypothetical protein
MKEIYPVQIRVIEIYIIDRRKKTKGNGKREKWTLRKYRGKYIKPKYVKEMKKLY